MNFDLKFLNIKPFYDKIFEEKNYRKLGKQFYALLIN